MHFAEGRHCMWALLVGRIATASVAGCSGGACPEQRHLSFGETAEKMVAIWVTPAALEQPACEFGRTPSLGMSVTGMSTKIWQVGGISEVSHTCELSPLLPGESYFYKVGDKASGIWSTIAKFVAKPLSTTWAPTILVYGDLGAGNDVSLPTLTKEAMSGAIDFVLHVGDFAYDFFSNGGEMGRAFMREIDPIASQLPYMTCLGNHEGGTDLDHISSLYHYMHRFQMPGKGDAVHGDKGNNVFYSFDAGPAHIIAFSSEVYFWQLWDAEAQFAFLQADLAAVDRRKTPWIVTMAHRPMYCSNTDGDDCSKVHSNVRTGLPVFGKRRYQLEKLFKEHKVDLAFWAHEHSYERTWPVFDNKVMNGSSAPYVDPGATVHIVSGNAGCREGHDHFNGPRGSWSAVRSETYGYGKLRVLNASHLQWQQFDAVSGSLVDEVMLVKSKVPAVGQPSPARRAHGRLGPIARATQQQREEIYTRTRGCTARGALPQNGCIRAEESAGVDELVV